MRANSCNRNSLNRAFVALVVVAAVSASTGAMAAADQNANSPAASDAIIKRLDALESENAVLRERVRRLESTHKSATASVTAAPARASTSPSVRGENPNGKLYDTAAPSISVMGSNWTGFYLGAHGGYGWGHDPFTEVFPSSASGSGGQPPYPVNTVSNISSTGFVAGFQAGYNQQWGRWIGGIEIDLSGANIKGSKTSFVFPTVSCGIPTCTDARRTTIEDKFDTLASARARVGFLPLPSVLLYGTGGPAWGHIEQRVDDLAELTLSGFPPFSGPFPGTTPLQSSTTTPAWRFGWAAGAGAEARVLETNWLARVEYLHYAFGNSGSFAQSTGASLTSGTLSIDVVRGGLSYQFGGGSTY